MRLATRLIALAIIVVLIIGIAGVGLFAWITNRALPQTSGDLQVPGLSAPVSVVRDASGIAHITADTPHDLFMAQGYVHAQERMWQMEVWRHISAGRLSELFGESQVDTDRFIRTVGWRQAAARDLAAYAPSTIATLDAYTAGVNAWLDRNRGSLGLAYLVTGTTPEPWTNLDTVTWAKVQAWDLGNDLASEIFRYLADARLGDPSRTDALFPPYPEGAPIITPSGLAGSGGAGADRPPVASVDATVPPAARALTEGQSVAWRHVAALGRDLLEVGAGGGTRDRAILGARGIGSNDWVVGPEMSSSGGALLANDPHLGVSMPSIWIMNGLHCRTISEACPYDVAGVSFPGAPGVVLGHNGRVAWGATNIYADVQDLVIETVDPADPGRYLTSAGSLPFTVRHEEIGVSGGQPVALDVRETVHGPILNEVDDDLADAPPMALRWTAIQGEDHTLESVLALMTVADFDGFREALRPYGAPAQNFVYADVDGHIGYQFPGFMPVRSDASDTGLRPVDGADGRHEWIGRIPFDDLPWQFDPEPGWIVTANNAPVDANYPYRLGTEWDPGDRAQRIIDLVNDFGQDGLTVDELGQIQMDSAPLRARDVGFLLSDLTDPATGAATSTADGALIRDRIDTWDGACDVDSLGCAAYMSWEYRLQRDIFDDELGPLARDYVGSGESWLVVTALLDDPNAAWWDDTSTTEVVETGPVIVARAMDEAGAELRTALGAPESWTWGRLHQVAFNEPTLGESGIGPLEWFFDKGPFPVAGADGAPDATSWDAAAAYADPTDPEVQPVGIDGVFEVTGLPSYRLAIDMSDLDAARIVITTGQSGNPGDAHYGDMIEAWRTGGTVPLPFTPAAIAAAATTTLTLTP